MLINKNRSHNSIRFRRFRKANREFGRVTIFMKNIDQMMKRLNEFENRIKYLESNKEAYSNYSK